jgi:membrane protein
MARLRDVPRILRSVGPFTFAWRVWTQTANDNVFTWAAALAYSYLFAVFPFFIFLLTLIPLLPLDLKAQAEKEIGKFIYLSLPRDTAYEFWLNMKQVLDGVASGTTFRVVGLATALWAAAGGMVSTMNALDRCYNLPLEGGRPFWKQRLLAICMTVIIVVLIVSVVVLLPVGTIVKNWVVSARIPYVEDGPFLIVLFDVARWALAVLFMVSVLTVLYHFGPNVKHHFRWLTPGSVFTIVMWVALGLAFKFYVEKYGRYGKTYGSVAGVAILLLVFYIDAVVLLMGAEINSEIDFEVLKIKRGTRDFRPAEEGALPQLFDEDGVVEPATAQTPPATTGTTAT